MKKVRRVHKKRKRGTPKVICKLLHLAQKKRSYADRSVKVQEMSEVEESDHNGGDVISAIVLGAMLKVDLRRVVRWGDRSVCVEEQ